MSNLDITVINGSAKLNKLSLERFSELNNDEKTRFAFNTRNGLLKLALFKVSKTGLAHFGLRKKLLIK